MTFTHTDHFPDTLDLETNAIHACPFDSFDERPTPSPPDIGDFVASHQFSQRTVSPALWIVVGIFELTGETDGRSDHRVVYAPETAEVFVKNPATLRVLTEGPTLRSIGRTRLRRKAVSRLQEKASQLGQ